MLPCATGNERAYGDNIPAADILHRGDLSAVLIKAVVVAGVDWGLDKFKLVELPLCLYVVLMFATLNLLGILSGTLRRLRPLDYIKRKQ